MRVVSYTSSRVRVTMILLRTLGTYAAVMQWYDSAARLVVPDRVRFVSSAPSATAPQREHVLPSRLRIQAASRNSSNSQWRDGRAAARAAPRPRLLSASAARGLRRDNRQAMNDMYELLEVDRAGVVSVELREDLRRL